MNPTLHKYKELNEIIECQNFEYISITENLQTEVWPIVARPVYYKSGISKILHLILEPSLSVIPHILKDSFDFLERFDTTCSEDTLLSSCDIKSLYTNFRHDVFYKTIDYWIEKTINEIPLLRRFTKAFVIEGLSIIWEFNYFYINNYFYHQIKRTAMGTIFAVVYKIMNELDPDLQFIFQELTKNINFLDISLKINYKLHFDVYHKPANSFSYLHYKSCHPPHMKNNICVTDNTNNQLQELKGHLLKRKHLEK